MSLRIALTVNYSPWSPYSGGGQSSTHQLATALSRRGHEVWVVYTKAQWEQINIPQELTYKALFADFPGFKSKSSSLGRPFSAFSVKRIVGNLLRIKNIQIVHSQGEEGALLANLRPRQSFAFITTPRYPNFPKVLLQDRPHLLGKLLLWITNPKYFSLGRTLETADIVAPTSQATTSLLKTAYVLDPEKFHVIPNGVANCFLEVLRSSDAESGPILFFGRLDRKKGCDVLLKAISLLEEPIPVMIIGRGPEKCHLTNQVKHLNLSGQVSFEDWLSSPKLAEKLSSASMVVLPSSEESFGNTMVESMASGAPLITTHVGSIPEVVLDGKTGILVPPNDPDSLAKAISKLLTDRTLANTLGAEGKKHVRSHFSWETTADKFEYIYRQMLQTSFHLSGSVRK